MPGSIGSRAGAHTGWIFLVGALVWIAGCGSDSNGGETPVGGGAGEGGSDATGGAGGGGTGGTGGTAMPGDCSQIAPAEDGAVQGVSNPFGSNNAGDVVAACDGSFVVTGNGSVDISFERRDGSLIELSNADTWIARFDRDGFPLWANAVTQGNGLLTWSYVAPFADGAVSVGGVFGTSATFGAGLPNETTLTADSSDPNGYIARYDAQGAFQWVRHIGPRDESRVWGVGAGSDNMTFAALDTANPNGNVIDPDGINLELAGGEGAVVALDENGAFVHSSRYSGVTVQLIRFGALAGGGVLLAAEANDNAIVAMGTPQETALSSAGVFLASFTATLELNWVRSVTVPASSDATSLLPDGSAAFAGDFTTTVTLGVGEPNEVTLTNEAGDGDGVVSRLDADGELLWATQLAGDELVDLHALSAQRDGSVWVAGTYGRGVGSTTMSTLELGPGTPDAMSVETTGQFTFIARFTPEGSPAWVVPFGGSVAIQTLAAAPLALSAIGEFGGSASFGDVDLSGDGVFIARLGP